MAEAGVSASKGYRIHIVLISSELATVKSRSRTLCDRSDESCSPCRNPGWAQYADGGNVVDLTIVGAGAYASLLQSSAPTSRQLAQTFAALLPTKAPTSVAMHSSVPPIARCGTLSQH